MFQVATHPDGFQTEEECMKLFEDAVEFSKLKELGGGLGKAHLFSQLVQLQEEMLEGMPRFIVQVRRSLTGSIVSGVQQVRCT